MQTGINFQFPCIILGIKLDQLLPDVSHPVNGNVSPFGAGNFWLPHAHNDDPDAGAVAQGHGACRNLKRLPPHHINKHQLLHPIWHGCIQGIGCSFCHLMCEFGGHDTANVIGTRTSILSLGTVRPLLHTVPIVVNSTRVSHGGADLLAVLFDILLTSLLIVTEPKMRNDTGVHNAPTNHRCTKIIFQWVLSGSHQIGNMVHDLLPRRHPQKTRVQVYMLSTIKLPVIGRFRCIERHLAYNTKILLATPYTPE
mmetsp:Transcript_32015/g.53989  ORF Transcript_32015/g.53989 Transcript_32015/m.53989 type:complete len:253 (-) Transcript_32015:716-1474(-)